MRTRFSHQGVRIPVTVSIGVALVAAPAWAAPSISYRAPTR
jgi:hypothetical protein